MLRLLLLAMGAWSCMLSRAAPMAGSTSGARKISPLVPAQVEQAVTVDTEVEMTGIVEMAEARINIDVEITTEAAEEEEAKFKLVADAELETSREVAEIKQVLDMDHETTTEVVVVDPPGGYMAGGYMAGGYMAKAKVAFDNDFEITTEDAEIAEEEEEAKIKLVAVAELESATDIVDMHLETTTEAVAQPYRGPFRSAECKNEKKELMKKECAISGHNEHCQTFEIEVERIVEEEICHNITTLVCKAPLIRSGEEAETTTTAADAETETVTNQALPYNALDKSDEESTNPMMMYGRSIEYQHQLNHQDCVNKVSEVCYPSQRVEKELRPKEFCWEKDVMSCHEEVAQTVDTVVCNDDKALAQVRMTTIEPDTTTIDHEQLGRILVVATTTTAEDLTTTAETEEVARIVVGTTTTADDLATTTAEAVEAKILVAATTTAEDLATTAADEVARILVATTTTADNLATTTEDIATTGADELGRILVAGTTAEPETTVEPKAEADNSMEEQPTGTAGAKVAAARVTTVAPQETTGIVDAKVAEGDSISNEDEETAAITTENEHDLGDHDDDDHDHDDHDHDDHDHDDNDHDDHDQDQDQVQPEPETKTDHEQHQLANEQQQ